MLVCFYFCQINIVHNLSIKNVENPEHLHKVGNIGYNFICKNHIYTQKLQILV